ARMRRERRVVLAHRSTTQWQEPTSLGLRSSCRHSAVSNRAAMEHLHYPNESAEYRAARNALHDDEIALRAQIEAVAAKRRALPLGGEVPQDYVFERIGKNSMPEKVTISELFGPHE